MEKNWWQSKTWTGIPLPAHERKPVTLAAEPFHPCIPFSWMDWALPSENQNGPSCAGHGMANFKEIMLRRFHPAGHGVFKSGYQIDGDAIWARGRKMFWNGNMNGGLYISQAFRAAVDMGIHAPGSTLCTIPRREAMYSPQFELTPFIDGRDVSGWQKYATQPNGQVFEDSPIMDGSGGHCTIDVSRMTQGKRNFWQDQNSWGRYFGWHGCFIISEEEDIRTGLEDIKYYVVEPEGWEQWDGWRKHLWRIW